MDKPEVVRRRLPDTRDSFTHRFEIHSMGGMHKCFLVVGMFEDGTLGEIFVHISKEGSTLSGFADWGAKLASGALQYGMPVEKFADLSIGLSFEPSGPANGSSITYAKSIPDYIGQWVKLKFLSSTPEKNHGAAE